MQYLDLSLPTPEENLACDEALLNFCEAGYDREILRLWESPTPFVVLGHGNRAADEANLADQRVHHPSARGSAATPARSARGGTRLERHRARLVEIFRQRPAPQT